MYSRGGGEEEGDEDGVKGAHPEMGLPRSWRNGCGGSYLRCIVYVGRYGMLFVKTTYVLANILREA